MTIRPATVKDIENISVLYVKNHKTTYKGLVSEDYLSSLTVEKAKEKWSSYLEDAKSRMWVAYDECAFLGFVASIPDATSDEIWYLDSLHICEAVRGKGTGTSLIKTVGQYALTSGYGKMSVCVVKGNDSAKKLYMKLGARHLLSIEDKFDNSRINSEKLIWDDLKIFI